MVVVGPFECYGRLLVGTNRPVEMSKKLHQFQLIWWTNLSWCRVKGGNIRRVMGVHTVTSRCRLETNTISCNVILHNVEGGNGGGAQPACPPCRDRSPLATAAVPAPSKQKQNSFGFIFSIGDLFFDSFETCDQSPRLKVFHDVPFNGARDSKADCFVFIPFFRNSNFLIER